LNDDFERMIWS